MSSSSPERKRLRHDFRWAAREVARQEAKEGNLKRSLPLRVLDTVFLRPAAGASKALELDRWVYTNRSGMIAEKKADDLTWAKIQERFVKFSLSNPENNDKTVAVLQFKHGNRRLLDQAGLSSFAMAVCQEDEEVSGYLHDVTCLQCYLRPLGGSNQVFRASYAVDDSGTRRLEVTPVVQRGETTATDQAAASDSASVDERIQESLQAIAWEVIRYLELSGGLLLGVKVDFIVDDNHDGWITAIHEPKFSTQSAPSSSSSPARPLPTNNTSSPEPPPIDPPPPPQSSTARPKPERAKGVIVEDQEPSVVVGVDGDDSEPVGGASPVQHKCPTKGTTTAKADRRLNQVLSVYGAKPSRAAAASKDKAGGSKRASVMEAAMANFQIQSERLQEEGLIVGLAQTIPPPAAHVDPALELPSPAYPSPTKKVVRKSKGPGGVRTKSEKADGDMKAKVIPPVPASSSNQQTTPTGSDGHENQRLGQEDGLGVIPGGPDVGLMVAIKENRQFNEALIQLREKNIHLESELDKIKSQLRRSEEARLHAETEAKDNQRKMLTAKQSFTRAMQEKEEAHKNELLEMESKHNKELSVKAAEMAALRKQDANKEVPEENRVVSTAQANKHLVQKLEDLEIEFNKAKTEWAREKRNLLSSHAQELQEVSTLHREQGASSTTYIAKLEDELEDLKSQLDDARKLVGVMKRREEEANQRRLAAEAHQERLTAEKRQLQEHLQAAQAFEVQQNNVPVDGEKALAALTATSEARVRQANNKIEYLKAQLGAEQTYKGEMEATVASMKEKLLKQKQEFKNQLLAAEESKKLAVKDCEDRLRQEMEGYISEVAHLQNKVMVLQGQLGDALQDVGLAKRREEGKKGEATKYQLEVAAMQFQIDTLKKQLDENSKNVALDEDYRAKLATSEAMLRRLDNERLYLKSQLATEITCKNELQATLDQAHKDMADAKMVWKKDKEELEENIRQASVAREAIEADFKQHKIHMEAEVSAMSQQVTDLKTAYTKTREQLRIEQAAMERVQAANRRLQDELLAQHEELKHTRGEMDVSTKRQAENLELVKASIEELEAEKAKEIARLQSELHSHLKKKGELQDELADFQRRMVGIKRLHRRDMAAQSIFLAFHQWQRSRQSCALAVWRQSCVVMGLEAANARRVRMTCNDAEARIRMEMEEKCSTITAELRHEKDVEVERITTLAEEEMERLRQQAHDDKVQALAALKERGMEAARCREMTGEERLTRFAFRHQAIVARMKFEEEERVLHLEASHEGECARLKLEHEKKVAEATSEAKEEAEARWQRYVKDKLGDLKKERAGALDAARDQYNRALDRKMEQFQQEKQTLLAKAATEQDEAVAEEKKAAEEKLMEELKIVTEDFNKRLQDFEKQCQARIKQVEAEGLTKVREVEEEVKKKEQQHIKEVVEIRRLADEQRSKAVRMEIAKWQKALQEAEQQMEVDKKSAWKRGVEEREAIAHHEAAQLKIAGELALNEVKESARFTLEMTKKKSREEVEKIKEELLREKEDALRDLRERLSGDLTEQFEEELERTKKQAQKDKAAAVEEEKRQARANVSKLEQKFSEERVIWEIKERKLHDNITAVKEETAIVRQAMAKAIEDADLAFEKARESWMETEREALQKQAQDLLAEKEDALREAASIAEVNKENALDELHKACDEEMERTIQRIEEEKKSVIAEMEVVIAQGKKEKQEVERLLKRRQDLLDETVGRIEEMQALLSTEHKKSSFSTMKMLMAFMRARKSHESELATEKEKAVKAMVQVQEERTKEKQALEDEIAGLESVIEGYDSRRAVMYETLVNHKREVLMEHKVQSEVLAREAEQMALSRASVDKHKKQLQHELKSVEEGAKDLEEEIRQHSKKSSIKHGRIDVAHARKKKRLDEELETAIETIEAKRGEIGTVESRLAELAEQRQQKDDEMKYLERKLVEVLVEQQKKLLQILTEEGLEAQHLQRERNRGKRKATSPTITKGRSSTKSSPLPSPASTTPTTPTRTSAQGSSAYHPPPRKGGKLIDE